MRPVVVELIGPAGAGKSSVLRAMRQLNPRVRTDLHLWGLPRGLLLAAGARQLPRAVGRALWRRRPLAWDELVQMVRVEALERSLAQLDDPRTRSVVLDEGPVFALGWMEVFYPGNGTRAIAPWRRHAIAAWRDALDAIVFLDAPDTTLIRRIRTRPKPHMVKDWPDADIRDFTARFRTAFVHALAELAEARPIPVHTLRTDCRAPADVAARILALLEERHRGR